MCHGFGLDRPTAYHLLATEFNPRCVPPWDLSSIRESRDFERKIDEAIRQRHDRPHGWLADAAGYATDDSAVEHGAEVASALLARFNSAKATAEKMAAVDDTPAVSVIEAAGEDGDGATAGLPAWILSPPGLVGELCSWINATAFKPQPILALANAIAFWGAVVGRKVRDEWDLRTNVYTLGVAESGAGKDHSRKCIKRLAAAAGGLAAGLLAGEDVASDSGLLQSVFNNPATLFQLDEIGHFIAQANDRNAQAYTKRIPVTLTKLYSSASSMFRGKEYKTDDRIDIVQPNVCIYGTTNPATFFEGITTTQVRDGFLGRLLVFQTDNNDPDPIAAKPTDPPAGMVVCVLKWLERYIEAPAGVVGNLATREFPWQITVKTEPQAEAIFIDLRADARRRRRKIIGDRSGLDALWSRAEENARKVALVIASSCAYDAPIIGADLANYAATLVSVLTDQLVDAIRHNVADTDTGRIKNKILAVVRSRRGGVTSTDISRSLKHERPRDRREALADLVEAGELVIETINTVGRPATRYRIG
ncbi:MAG: hypothetical protein GC162_19555 [Planctomycetes bacterium]|nr:hypothetical protein [Planctomycetota bacterium]